MTPIQKAIAKIDKQIGMLKLDPECNAMAIGCLTMLNSWLADQLPYERKCIERAYNAGINDHSDYLFAGNPEHKNASDYFTKTYGHDS